MVRINKYLKDIGLCSRRKAEEFILQGYIKINGKVVTDLSTQINVIIDNVEVSPLVHQITANFTYILLNKPPSYVCSNNQQEGKTIFELIPPINNITYAGRLDKDSHGLVVMSNDGKFIYKLTGSEFALEKEYIVRVDKPLTNNFLLRQANGSLIIDNKNIKPAKIKQISTHVYKIILTEGINRQIRKMAQAFDYNVIDLKRIRIANLTDTNLTSGNWRTITLNEIKNIMQF